MAKILFVSEACLLDRKSGAAQSVRAILQALSDAGHDCHAATMSIFDGNTEYPLPPQLREDERGAISMFRDRGTDQRVFRTSSTQLTNIRPWDVIDFQQFAMAEIRRIKPDIVVTYSSKALWPVLQVAQLYGARTVFYLGVSAYADRQDHEFKHIDTFITPSQALADLYKEKRGILAEVVHNIIDFNVNKRIPADVRLANRSGLAITMVNPDPLKGGGFFIHLADAARQALPNAKFCAVEGRWGRLDWEKCGLNSDDLPNLSWHPNTDNMTAVYDEASMLIMPTLNFEGSGRVILEAMQSGLPVLAMDMGGIAEQLDGGGFLFECPSDLRANHFARPDPETIGKWLHFISVLLHDDRMYARAVDLALAAANRSDPHARRKAAVDMFEKWLATPVGLGNQVEPQTVKDLADLRARMNTALQRAEEIFRREMPVGGALGQESEELPFAEAGRISMLQPAMRSAAQLAISNDLAAAKKVLTGYLRLMPHDCNALILMGGILNRRGQILEAGALFARAADLAPGLIQARDSLIANLIQQGAYSEALTHSFELLARFPTDAARLGRHGQFLVGCHMYEEAASVFTATFKQTQGSSDEWVSYGDALRALGRAAEASNAFSVATERNPNNGVAWYRLAEMRSGALNEDEAARFALHCSSEKAASSEPYTAFASGMVKHASGDVDGAFASYTDANVRYASNWPYDPKHIEAYVADAKSVYSPALLTAKAQQCDLAEGPIFIVGLHRSGSTLLEQMLASHSEVEGLGELPFLPQILGGFGGFDIITETAVGLNAPLLEKLTSADITSLTRSYVHRASERRKTDRTYFVDKLPTNWIHVGAICRLFPHAKIIDIRRAPMATGFAQYRKALGQGTGHAQDLNHFARYYRAYEGLMDHFDTVLPGRIHHVSYENLVTNTRDELEAILSYCKLDFEDACLEHWETARVITTPSAEKVRQPLTLSMIDDWTQYRSWLVDLEVALKETQ